MAIKKHAMTKEGAILSITRNQIGKLSDGKKPVGILKSFIDMYMKEPNDRIKETYRVEFGIELEIVEYK